MAEELDYKNISYSLATVGRPMKANTNDWWIEHCYSCKRS